MFSRRSLLWMSGLGAGLAWAPRLRAQRAGTGMAPTRPRPPSIAALRSLKERARPFTNEERLARIEKAKKLMAQEKIDAILLASGTSPVYFANFPLGRSERL